jgi:dethiobiotin synthetase
MSVRRAPLVVVSGTGTEIGKTHFAAALVRAWHLSLARRGRPSAVAGIKPIESGGSADGDILGRMSTFHVKRFPAPYLLRRPVSPHLAARDEGVTIAPAVVVHHIEQVRAEADAVLVELPGGLFSPLSVTAANADLARALDPSTTLLVAPDRLGVLHDVIATTRAAATAGLRIDGVVLSTPATPDASTGTNAAELRAVAGLSVLGVLPRADIDALVSNEALQAVLATVDP